MTKVVAVYAHDGAVYAGPYIRADAITGLRIEHRGDPGGHSEVMLMADTAGGSYVMDSVGHSGGRCLQYKCNEEMAESRDQLVEFLQWDLHDPVGRPHMKDPFNRPPFDWEACIEDQ